MKVFGCTHPGPRTHNEDCYGIIELDDTLLLIVADGLGGHNAGEVVGDFYKVDVDGVLLLCADGLYDHVQDEEIARIVVRDGGCEGLVNLALSRGGKDNVTIVLFKMER